MSLMVNGPKQGDESYEQYVSEKKEILASLRRRAHMMTVSLRRVCQPNCEQHNCDHGSPLRVTAQADVLPPVD